MHKLRLFFGLVFMVILISACSDSDNDSNNVNFGDAPISTLTSGTIEVITEDQVRYHIFNAGGGAYIVTMVESAIGLTIIDLGPIFLDTLGTELRDYADAINKPMAVVITHAHRDHYGNISAFNDVDYYAESTVADILMTKTDFSSVVSNVNKVSDSQVIGGFTFKFDKISAAETNENGYLYMESTKALFPGDLIYNQAHNYIREYTPLEGGDELTNWINGLNTLKSNFGAYNHVFVGHGGTRTDVATVIDENIAYLTDAQELIKGTKTLTAGGTANTVEDVVDELDTLYPNYADGALKLALPGAFDPDDPGSVWF